VKRLALALAALFVFEWGLGHLLAAWGFGGKLLAMGPHTPTWALAAGVMFVLARLLLVVLGPGVLLALVTWHTFDMFVRFRDVTGAPRPSGERGGRWQSAWRRVHGWRSRSS